MERILVPVEDCPRLFKKADNGDTPPQDLEGVVLGTVPKRVRGRWSGDSPQEGIGKGIGDSPQGSVSRLGDRCDVHTGDSPQRGHLMDIPGTVPKGGIHEKKLFCWTFPIFP